MHHEYVLEVRNTLSPIEIDQVSKLFHLVSKVTSHTPLGEHRWLDLVQGGRAAKFAILAYRHQSSDVICGYAQVSHSDNNWALDLVTSPGSLDESENPSRLLLSRALELVAENGGGHVHWWVPQPTPFQDMLAMELGMSVGRDLFQLRIALPTSENFQQMVKDFQTRPFQINQDEQSWLEVNNSAFSWHPEQGGWTREILERRQLEPWFDLSGFLVHEIDGKMAGFCWTKVHEATHPPMGEIYVIAVHPNFQSRGLGKQLVVAGLNYLSRKGLTVGMLYVDSENHAARHLYEQLGFHFDHNDRAYVVDITV